VLTDERTSFVGRQAELTRLVEIARPSRLITVTGAGGVGKTRLAREAARLLQDAYPDGVCLVGLSALQVPGLLPNTVGSALGLAGPDAREALDSVLDYLRDRSVLLILDTCEHLVEACAEFARTVTTRAPGVSVVATSRQPLGAKGERTLPLLPLPVPRSEREMSPGDAVDLFVQRAADAVPRFTLDDDNCDEVIRICERLAGIPLALELAAVQLRTLSLSELVAGFGMTDSPVAGAPGSRRTAISRNQDLRTSIGWSYQLCTPAERTLWRRMSVFAGSFGHEALAAVCAGCGTSREETDAAVEGLVAKSVLLEDPELTGNEGRYRLLDPTREFGAIELETAENVSAVRGRHIAYYLHMARDFGRHAVDNGQLTRYRQLRGEHANIRAAMEYAFALPGNERAAIDIATSMFLYWHMSGTAWEGEYWVNRALEHCSRSAPLRARVLVVRAYLLCILGEIADAREDAMTAIKVAERLGDTDTVARGYACLHRALTWGDELGLASSITETTVRLLTEAGDDLGLAQLAMQEIFADLRARDATAAASTAAAGLERLPPGELWARGYLLMQEGICRFVAGDQAGGAARVRRAVTMKHELGDVVGVAYCVGILGLMAADQGRYERAAWLLGAGEALWERAGRRYTGSPYLEEWHQRATTAALEDLGPDHYKEVWDRGVTAGPDALALVAVTDSDTPARR
jgi:non-specific serine/threonine protein kinase